MIFAVDNTQSLITSSHIIHANSKSHNIAKLLKGSIFLLHFAPNGIRRFFSAGNGGFNAIFFHIFLQLRNNSRHQVIPLLTQKVQTGNNGVMSFFM